MARVNPPIIEEYGRNAVVDGNWVVVRMPATPTMDTGEVFVKWKLKRVQLCVQQRQRPGNPKTKPGYARTVKEGPAADFGQVADRPFLDDNVPNGEYQYWIEVYYTANGNRKPSKHEKSRDNVEFPLKK